MDANQICDLLDVDLVNFIHNIIVLLKIAVPVILVILGMFDFAKGVMSSKEDEIKKGQQTFIKRLIAAALVFFVVTIVQLVMGLVSKEDNSFWNCANGILNGTAGGKYEPTGVTGNENTDAGDDSNTGIDNPRQSETLERTNGSVTCRNNLYYTEYNNCLSNGHNSNLCLTFFQDFCSSSEGSLSWKSNDSYSQNRELAAMKKYTCTLSNGSESDALKKQLYSCGLHYSSTFSMTFDQAVDSCAKMMGNYCK